MGPITETYAPQGYPALDLTPLGGPLRSTKPGTLRVALEDVVVGASGRRFRAAGIGKLDLGLAQELANVTAALCEHYPTVELSAVYFSDTGLGGDTLMCALDTGAFYPVLHDQALEIGDGNLGAVLSALTLAGDRELLARAKTETARLQREWESFDLCSSGTIHISPEFSSERGYDAVRRFFEARNRWCDARGLPRRIMDNRVSVASFLLLHEFGHLVDSELGRLGDDAERHVYGALEEGLLYDDGARRISRQQVRSAGLRPSDVRLVAYPQYWHPALSGQGARRRAQRRTVGPAFTPLVGSYARHYREELFAESFALLHSARDPELVQRLRGFRTALRDVGLKHRRRRQR